MTRYNLIYLIVISMAFLGPIAAATHEGNERGDMHPENKATPNRMRINSAELDIEYWRANGQQHLRERLCLEENLNTNKAKNIIMFLGDGMSIQTTAATRMYMGGEELSLSFEKFPHFGLSKTYCVDRQVADSACTATAFLHGVKANYGTMGVTANVPRSDCNAQNDAESRTTSITQWAQENCKATGLVTTSRVTHSTPGGVYAHTANRDWENDQEVRRSGCDVTRTKDIAQQLIDNPVAQKLKVVLGCGRRQFRDRCLPDEEGSFGSRSDGKDLIQEWLQERNKHGNASFIWNEQQLKSLDIERTDYLMGLFEADHCMYNIDIKNKGLQDREPSLSEMTEAAIKILQKEENGYFLFVESGRIDMAHHENWARKALDETEEFSETVEMIRRMTNQSDTLIVVTADHGQVMTYNGNPFRGNDILGLSGQFGEDGLPYTTLSYANGMGFFNTFVDGTRKDVSSLDFSDPNLAYMATVPRTVASHAGDDVGVYASGPWSHIFTGTYEQNNIPIAMAFAAKIGPYAAANDECENGAASHLLALPIFVTLCISFAVQCFSL